MIKEIEWWLEKLPLMTQDEANFLADFIKLDEEKRAAFMFAKQIFEEPQEKCFSRKKKKDGCNSCMK